MTPCSGPAPNAPCDPSSPTARSGRLGIALGHGPRRAGVSRDPIRAHAPYLPPPRPRPSLPVLRMLAVRCVRGRRREPLRLGRAGPLLRVRPTRYRRGLACRAAGRSDQRSWRQRSPRPAAAALRSPQDLMSVRSAVLKTTSTPGGQTSGCGCLSRLGS